MVLYIKLGSVTNAQRAYKILYSSGYKPRIKRIENPDKSEGCGYAVELACDDEKPIDILEKNRMKIRGYEWQ